jgi:ABC-type transport system involved in multi-copper enzyme maturation permease subunit
VNQTLAIAINTFKETVRDRILAVIVLFALGMIVASLWLASLSLGQGDRMMRDFGLVAVSLFGLIVAVFVAGSLVHKEVEKRTVFVLFSKPVGRSEFIWGKFLGLAATMLVVVAGMGLFLFAITWLVAHVALGSILLATLLVFVQLLAVMAVTIFFSTFASAILSSVLGVCVFAAGQLSHNVLSLTRLGHAEVLKAVSWVVFLLIPNLTAVDIKGPIAGEGSIDWGGIGAWVCYLLAYVVVCLVLAALAAAGCLAVCVSVLRLFAHPITACAVLQRGPAQPMAGTAPSSRR